jgi:hypothetical protein
VFQFYHLAYLWEHLRRALEQDIPLVNLVTEPLSAAEVFFAVKGHAFHNELAAPPLRYDARTIHADKLGGNGGYLSEKNQVLDEIVAFVRAEEARIGL